ncbi:MAG: hypothetical protein KatS3mg076_2879 [Candidatus Binatia bacterium]|nr:MAG: hypothetical protein KatS3mg076_2879 [Candidatus Binatia bacterium]
MSLRSLARLCGVQVHTIQHHFGSKRNLFAEVLDSWNRELRSLVRRALENEPARPRLFEHVVDEVFDFFLRNPEQVRLATRALLGEGIPSRDRSWVRFMSEAARGAGVATRGFDLRLLLVTLEGILHHHALAAHHYRNLFGRDIRRDPSLARKTKRHLQRVLRSLFAIPEATS